MTRAHISSRLSVRNASPVLPEGMILFPLDGRVTDTLDSIPVSVNSTVFYDHEKKFFTSTGVEDGTVNLLSAIPNYVDWNTQGILSSSYVDTDGYTVKKYWKDDGTAFNAIWWAVSPSPNTNVLHSYSVYARGQGTAYAIVHQANRDNSTTQSGISGSSVTLDKYEWTRLTVERYYISDGSSNQNVLISLNEGAGNYIEVKKPQLEALDHVSTYVNGSRPWGCLRYDISSLLVRDAGCLSCWIFNSDTMLNYRANGTSPANNQYLLKVGSDISDGYKDNITIRIPGGSTRIFTVFTSPTGSTQGVITAPTQVTDLGLNTWNHFVLQWDKSGLPTGNAVELYINGKLEIGSTSNATLPTNYLTYLHVGNWSDYAALMPSTYFEQLAIHPSKGFSPDVIENWYKSDAPFFDSRDAFSFI